jgi:2'-5' RNA ligase
MQLRLKGAGWFGASVPHAIWAGVEPDEALSDLARKCDRAARRFGLQPDKRSFRPHVTLAYCQNTPLEEAVAFCQLHAGLEFGPFWADRFHVFSSWSRKGPSRYISESEIPLGPVR